MEHFVRQPEPEQRDSRLDEDTFQNVPVHVMPEFVRENGFDFVVGIIIQQSVGENDAAGGAESGERGVSLLAFLGKMPLIDTPHAGAGAFAQNDQAALELLVFERFKLVKNRKQHNRRELCEQYQKSEENGPGDHPPVLRALAHEQVEKFDHNRGHDQADKKTLAFIPEPGGESLVGEVVAVLEPETIVLERRSQDFTDQHQHQDVEENGEGVILRSASLGQITERSRPTGGQQNDEQAEADHEIRQAQPPLDAVIAARLRRIGEKRCHFAGGHYVEDVVTMVSRYEAG